MEVNIDADNSEYLAQLQAEKDNIDTTFTNAVKLLEKEIQRIQSGGSIKENGGLIDVLKEKFIKKQERVLIPVKDYPKFNFVGKLLGPKGASLKRLQEETQTKMSILGRGSMKDKRKEEELRKEGGKYAHLNDDLHVLVEVYAPPAECHSRMAHAFFELKKYMNPTVSDEIHQQQLEEMMYMQQESGQPGTAGAMRGRGRGGQPLTRGRGAPRGTPTPRGAPAPRGVPALRGAPSMRGVGAASRGASGVPSLAPSRGAARGLTRGAVASRGAPRGGLGRAAPTPLTAPVSHSLYEDETYRQSYEDAYADPAYQDPYEQQEGTQLYDYGHQSTAAAEEYDDGYGTASYGADDAWNGTTAAGYGKLPSSRLGASARGSLGARAHPYSRGATARY